MRRGGFIKTPTEEDSKWTTIPRDSQGSKWIEPTVGIRGVVQFWRFPYRSNHSSFTAISPDLRPLAVYS